MKLAIGTCVATLAILAGIGVVAQDAHNEQRPSPYWESSYCKSAPWVVECDTPEETAERARVRAVALDEGTFRQQANREASLVCQFGSWEEKLQYTC